MTTTFFINWLGFLLIWIAADIGRKQDSKVYIFSWEFFWQAILITVGASIVH